MTDNDAGLQIVDKLFEKLMIDEPWAIRRPRGFTWWSYRLAQHVEAGPMTLDRGMQISRVRIWTEVVNGVDESSRPAEWLAVGNARQTLNALTWDPARGTVTECCTAVIHDENVGWMSKLLSIAAVMQNAGAHSRARALADLLRGEAAVSSHPISGERPQPDDILGVPEHVIAAAGKENSHFVGPLTQGLEASLRKWLFLGSAEADGMTCEVPFTGSSPAAVEVALGVDPHRPPETCLVRIFSDVEHPDYGHGALLVMMLPVNFPDQEVAAVANELNLLEATTEIPTELLGAWCLDPTCEPKTRIAFNAFLPNIVAEPNLLENMILLQAARSQYFGADGAEHLPRFGGEGPNG
ncbi:hypothetical protein [Mycolicibacterium austroafricanum]|uniref:hypothetical protein n=1 Tax=Mycolicibacterium austroafricanum TaxID=39687 RepID=UPI001CA322CB|nr:hypothetical protein [Mycolicibacterium austroafricanum]QZT60291.1 hypothetical protein JN085_14535 [Mycolicibacterium austroafricanum]